MDVDNQAGKELETVASLREMFSQACNAHASLTAFSCEGARISYRRLGIYSDRFAAWLLRESTLEAGDRIAIQLPNLIQYPVVVLGVIKAGMVIVNINPLYTAGETERQLRDSGARMLVTLEEILPVSSRILPGTDIEKVVVTRPPDLHPWPYRAAYAVHRKVRQRHQQSVRFSGRVEFGRVLGRGKKLLARSPLEENTAATTGNKNGVELGLIQYTGGTTGAARGVMLSHHNLLANMHQLDSAIETNCPPAGSVILAPLPLYHIYAFTLNILYSLYRGYHGILVPDPRDTNKLIRTIGRHKIHGLVGISTLFNLLCSHPDFSKLDFSNLRICTSGGMELSVRTARRWEKLTGCRIIEGYGLTETSPLAVSGNFIEHREGKIGKPTLWTEIKVVDDEGRSLPAGQPGEILIRGPQVMMGYWNQPGETRAALKDDGWLHSGDVGILDEEGFLTVVDRIKDMILVSGFNVYPAEIEDHVTGHPDIREAAAIGIPLEEGESVKLFVISDNPNLTEDDVIQYCRQGLTPYKVPGKVEFRATLPRSNLGKILKRQLRDDQAA